MARNNIPGKLYYSISEVAQITELEQYVLRYWEKEFSVLKPKKNRGGNRTYTLKDIELINRIKHLRTKEKLTIEGARNKLTLRKPGEEKTQITNAGKVRTALGQIKKDVKDLLKYFS